MKIRFRPILVCCMAVCIMPNLSYGQETADTQAIRALMSADQAAWHSGDAEGVLSLMDEHYCVFSIPKVDGELDFHGAEVGATPEDFKEFLGDPAWKGNPGVEAMADTALEWESTHELARIDVKGDYAVAISRIEWAQNDTIKDVRVSGGWESLWLLRKIDGNWKFTSAVGGISSWRDEEPRQ